MKEREMLLHPFICDVKATDSSKMKKSGAKPPFLERIFHVASTGLQGGGKQERHRSLALPIGTGDLCFPGRSRESTLADRGMPCALSGDRLQGRNCGIVLPLGAVSARSG